MAGTVYIPPFDEMLQASASLGLRSKAPPLWRGCVGYWPLSEGGGGTAFDLARNNSGTHKGDPTYVVGKYGRCLDFDGADDYIEFRDTIESASQDWWLSFWVYLDSYPGPGEETALVGNVSTTNSDGIFCDSDGDLYLRVQGSLGTKLDDTPINTNEWTHICVTQDADTDELTLYMNGEEMLIFGTDAGSNPWRTRLANFYGWHITDGGPA